METRFIGEWHLLTDEQWSAVVRAAASSAPIPDVHIAALVDRYRSEQDRAAHAGSPTPEQRRNDALDRIAAEHAYAELIARRENGEALPTAGDAPLVDPDDAATPSTAMSRVADSFTARNHAVSARTGLVTTRGRAAITGGIDHLRDDIAYLGDDIDVDSLPRDARGRIQSLALSALATRLYGLDELVGTDVMSWEELVDTRGADVAANMVTPAVLVSHRNPSDPVSALVDYIGAERVAWRSRSPHLDTSVWDDIADMGAHVVVRRPDVKRFTTRTRLSGGRWRSGDPEGTSTALRGHHDRVVIRRKLSDVRALAAGERDRVVVGTAPARYLWVGHRLARRADTKYQIRRDAQIARKRERSENLQSDGERLHIAALTTRIASLANGTAATYRIDGYRVRVSRTARGLFNVRVTTPTGAMFKRGDKRRAEHITASLAHIQRVERDRSERIAID